MRVEEVRFRFRIEKLRRLFFEVDAYRGFG
jgi:hypothetical protein